MNRLVLTFLLPPLAVCRYGCAGCCAAPIGVMWFASIVSVIYGFAGGPTNLETISWATVSLGVILWVVSVVWTLMVIRGVKDDFADPNCSSKKSTVCSIVRNDDESDPMSDINKLTH